MRALLLAWCALFLLSACAGPERLRDRDISHADPQIWQLLQSHRQQHDFTGLPAEEHADAREGLTMALRELAIQTPEQGPVLHFNWRIDKDYANKWGGPQGDERNAGYSISRTMRYGLQIHADERLVWAHERQARSFRHNRQVGLVDWSTYPPPPTAGQVLGPEYLVILRGWQDRAGVAPVAP